MLVLDDLHWADSGVLDLIESITHGLEDAPIVALCASRSELLERRTTWGRGSRNATLLELRPLRPADGDQLARELLPPEARHRAAEVAAAAGGNPFFEEEIARQVANSGGSDGGRLPDTVQAAIAARIDQLPADEKRVLQYAAVLGQTFRTQALADLLGGRPPSAALGELVRRELLQERVADGAGIYGFRHGLVRDVAYKALPRSLRRDLHEHAADWLDQAAGERHAELAELVAFHLERAASLAPTADREARAFEASVIAAEAALRRGATSRAQHLFEQAAEHAAAPADAVPVLRSAAEIAKQRFRGAEALDLYRAAGEAAEAAGDAAAAAANFARVVETASRFGGLTADAPPLEEQERLIERARELTPPDAIDARARLLADEAWLHWRGKDPEAMLKAATEAVALARQGDNVYVLSGALDAAMAAEEEAGRLGTGAASPGSARTSSTASPPTRRARSSSASTSSR